MIVCQRRTCSSDKHLEGDLGHGWYGSHMVTCHMYYSVHCTCKYMYHTHMCVPVSALQLTDLLGNGMCGKTHYEICISAHMPIDMYSTNHSLAARRITITALVWQLTCSYSYNNFHSNLQQLCAEQGMQCACEHAAHMMHICGMSLTNRCV